ncbi:latent-transforming growth factor [Lynx pardinus]|uniref:Latent-transforming growth factor n=1 Tax=Lynx pardinus TaxID=191816 RepID=A0A485P3Y7_LYNPA|nr:latent-transforming growth factor [Lynx pardinus]
MLAPGHSAWKRRNGLELGPWDSQFWAVAPSVSPSSSSSAPRWTHSQKEDLPPQPLSVAACRCCPGQSPKRSRCVRASCRVQSCPPEKCAGPQQCLTPVPQVLPSPSPSARKRQVSLNWQPLTLQEARALLRRRRPRGPGGRALLRRRPPQRAPAGQTRAPYSSRGVGHGVGPAHVATRPGCGSAPRELGHSGVLPGLTLLTRGAQSLSLQTLSLLPTPINRLQRPAPPAAIHPKTWAPNPLVERGCEIHSILESSQTIEALVCWGLPGNPISPCKSFSQHPQTSCPLEEYCTLSDLLPGVQSLYPSKLKGLPLRFPCLQCVAQNPTHAFLDGPSRLPPSSPPHSCLQLFSAAPGEKGRGCPRRIRPAFFGSAGSGLPKGPECGAAALPPPQHVISEAKGPCFRVLRDGGCSLPILRNITKQICCCSRVGKAWGRGCQLCPPFGSEGFREICPAGPGYHYSASDLRYNTRPLGQEPPRVSLSHRAPPSTSRPPTGFLPTHRPEPRLEPRPGPELPLPSIPAWSGPEIPESGPSAGVCQRNPQVCGPGRCIPRPSGYTCACDSGFRLSPQGTHCVDVDECHRVPPPCDRGRCENTPGSFLCVCPAGYQAAPHGAGCQDVDECTQSPGLCGRGVCENLSGSFRCVCPAGFRGSACEEDVDECAQEPPPCGPGRCDNTAGSFHCACPAGFRSQGPGAPCQDVDECARSPPPCAYGRCENTEGGFQCVCPTGFQPNAAGSECEDVDECENHLACPGQECVNSPGSFQCRACPAGHHLHHGRCTDVDECSSGASCGPHGHCTNTDGSFRCSCAPGYRAPSGRPGPCADVNECLEGDFCFPHGECLNTDGSFACTCAPGYRPGPRGASCLDVDECSEEDLCQSGICTNTDGSFECVCPPGHRAGPDLASCLDIDECRERGPALCGSQRCENSPGSYRCVRDCDPGYHAGPEGTCDDVDECQEYGSAICGAQRCENTPGSYRCTPACDPGYQPTPGGGCQDVDECRNRSFCGAHAVCQNLPGSFQCLCDQGYEGARDGRHCVDVNECETLQGVCGAALCENVEGSFLCVCPTSPEEFDPMTGRCVPPRTSAGTFPGSQPQAPASPGLPARPPPPSPPRRPSPPRQGPAGSGRRECYFDTAAPDACDNILARNVTWQECCCTVGEGWGSGCRIQQCPSTETAEYQSLCPHGRGYLAPSGDLSLRRDVDECQLFRDQVCKSGVCVNTAPGYSCYCSNGYYYHAQRLECVDNDECADEEPACEAASTPWALIIAPASPHWCWTAPGAAASLTRARASMTIWECAGRKWGLTSCAVALGWTARPPTQSAAASMARPGAWTVPSAPPRTQMTLRPCAMCCAPLHMAPRGQVALDSLTNMALT